MTVGGRSASLEIEHRFGFSEPFSIGVEEELFLVDPLTGQQRNSSAAVLERLGDVDGTVEQELHACEVELITNIHTRAGDAALAVGAMRRAVLQTGTGLLASGTHPSAREGDAAITHKERYERIHHLLGDAAVTPTAALHVHVGMPIQRPRYGHSTGYGASCRCCKRWQRTLPFATAATPAWPPPVKFRCGSGRAQARLGPCATTQISVR